MTKLPPSHEINKDAIYLVANHLKRYGRNYISAIAKDVGLHSSAVTNYIRILLEAGAAVHVDYDRSSKKPRPIYALAPNCEQRIEKHIEIMRIRRAGLIKGQQELRKVQRKAKRKELAKIKEAVTVEQAEEMEDDGKIYFPGGGYYEQLAPNHRRITLNDRKLANDFIGGKAAPVSGIGNSYGASLNTTRSTRGQE